MDSRALDSSNHYILHLQDSMSFYVCDTYDVFSRNAQDDTVRVSPMNRSSTLGDAIPDSLANVGASVDLDGGSLLHWGSHR